MANGRCRLHDGKSTGPKTPEGKERARLAGYKHGHSTNEAVERRKSAMQVRKKIRVLSYMAQRGISLGMTPAEIDKWLTSN